MGCTTSNFFQQIFDKYGDQLIKLVIAQKSKEKLDEKYIELINTLNQKIGIFKNKVNNLVDSKQLAIKQKFDQLKTQINQKVPGGLSVLERLKGKSINQISEFDKIQGQIDEIQKTSLSKVDQKKQELQKELASNKDNLRQQLENQRPKIAVYDQLPQKVRFKIVDQAYSKFQKEITEGSDKNKQNIDQKMNLNGLDSMLQNLSPQKMLQNFAEQSIKKMISNLAGDKLGGIINKIL